MVRRTHARHGKRDTAGFHVRVRLCGARAGEGGIFTNAINLRWRVFVCVCVSAPYIHCTRRRAQNMLKLPGAWAGNRHGCVLSRSYSASIFSGRIIWAATPQQCHLRGSSVPRMLLISYITPTLRPLLPTHGHVPCFRCYCTSSPLKHGEL